MSKLSKRHFWDWFIRHQQEFLTLNTLPKKEAAYWLNELTAHLRAYFKFLGFSLEWQGQKAATLTISVDGKAMHFKKAETFVATAPVIPGWRIAALEDPKPIDFMLEKEIMETGADPRELFFSFADNDAGPVGLFVYHPLCTKKNEYLFSELASAAIYNLLGERSFGLDIRYVDVLNLSYADKEDLQKLEELPDCIGLRKSSIIVDADGKLLDM